MKFSNGEPFDAEAAAENFRAVLDNRQRHAWLELANQIVDVKALSKTRTANYPEKRLLSFPARTGPAPSFPFYRSPRSLKTMKP